MQTKKLNNIDIFTCHNKCWDNILTKEDILSSKEKEKLNKYKLENDRKRFCVGRIMLRTIASKILGIKANKTPIAINKLGKPYIENSNHLFFNISHSGKWVSVAFAPFDIGVDVQQICHDKKIDFENVARHSFHHNEIEYLNKTNANNRKQKFYEIWSIKEAVIKTTGNDFFGCPQNFSIISENKIIPNLITQVNNINYYYEFLEKDYILSIASRSNIDDKISIKNFEKFI